MSRATRAPSSVADITTRRRSSRKAPCASSASARPRSASSERSWNSSNRTAATPFNSGSSRIMRANTPSVTTSIRVFAETRLCRRTRRPTVSPTRSPKRRGHARGGGAGGQAPRLQHAGSCRSARTPRRAARAERAWSCRRRAGRPAPRASRGRARSASGAENFVDGQGVGEGAHPVLTCAAAVAVRRARSRIASAAKASRKRERACLGRLYRFASVGGTDARHGASDMSLSGLSAKTDFTLRRPRLSARPSRAARIARRVRGESGRHAGRRRRAPTMAGRPLRRRLYASRFKADLSHLNVSPRGRRDVPGPFAPADADGDQCAVRLLRQSQRAAGVGARRATSSARAPPPMRWRWR